ncbi:MULTISPECIES: acetate/propionate family kinase [unclassified Mycoplasma]|uniref:acetate/propionate family kinase n=1 Tax=unclassified Mycoplasma TaxID=2683645 RepID=UPI002B1DC755|nr:MULTISPECIES: acetate/propionate family kinase [unclassified Mycoplasma]MEA4190930.1 acetate/propionate family kinase [Mycoplasma sp. 2248]MEA4206364.1 acetate/propionate family kinase [Mycoplasma sp. 1199]
MNKKVLVINAGSSSIKLSLFDKESLELIASGIAERITLPEGAISIKFNGQKFEKTVAMPNHEVAVNKLYELMEEINLIHQPEEIEYIGFRIVQGGTYFNNTAKITDEVINIVDKVSIYAPLHNPGAVQSIYGFRKVFPHAKLSGDFDTAFHTTINKVNSSYALPKELVEKYEIKRYGAHGISHQYITEKLAQILDKETVTFVNMHLGNGGSLCAVKDSKSFDTSMGLTPLAGIMMGTRSGDIDPSIHQFVMNESGLDINQFTDILNKQSGLLGVSTISSDMRDICAAANKGNVDAQFALELYSQKIADYVAVYANKIGGKPDALVFTAGIGENTPIIRQMIADKLFFKNIKLNSEVNYGPIGEFALISAPDSEVPVYVIRTNEELVIARNAIKIYEQN